MRSYLRVEQAHSEEDMETAGCHPWNYYTKPRRMKGDDTHCFYKQCTNVANQASYSMAARCMIRESKLPANIVQTLL